MQEMPQWLMVGLGVLGFLLTWTITAVTVTRSITSITGDVTAKLAASERSTSEKVAAETTKITDSMRALAEKFEEDQRIQDNRFGETVIALREYVNKVEKEMHQIEIWGRDNYVLKSEFLRALERIESAIEKMHEGVKDDIKGLHKRLERVMLKDKDKESE